MKNQNVLNINEKFAHLYKKEVKNIYRYIFARLYNKEDAEDTTSKTFTIAYKKFSEINFEEIKNYRAWLIQIARNVMGNQFQKRKFEMKNLDDYKNVIKDINNTADEIVVTKDQVQIIKKHLKKLDSLTREVLSLKIWEDYKFKEIADLTDIRENTAKTLYYRGLKKIKKSITKENDKYSKTRYASILIGFKKLSNDSLFIPKKTFVSSTIVGISQEASKIFYKLIGEKMITLFGKVFAAKQLAAVGITTLIGASAIGGGTYMYKENKKQDNSNKNEIISVNEENQEKDIIDNIEVKTCSVPELGFEVKIPVHWNCKKDLTVQGDEYFGAISFRNEETNITIGHELGIGLLGGRKEKEFYKNDKLELFEYICDDPEIYDTKEKIITNGRIFDQLLNDRIDTIFLSYDNMNNKEIEGETFREIKLILDSIKAVEKIKFKENNEVNFSETGSIEITMIPVNGKEKDIYKFVYADGSYAANELNMIFTEKSQCNIGNGFQKCETGILNEESYYILKGIQNGNEVEVSTLEIQEDYTVTDVIENMPKHFYETGILMESEEGDYLQYTPTQDIQIDFSNSTLCYYNKTGETRYCNREMLTTGDEIIVWGIEKDGIVDVEEIEVINAKKINFVQEGVFEKDGDIYFLKFTKDFGSYIAQLNFDLESYIGGGIDGPRQHWTNINLDDYLGLDIEVWGDEVSIENVNVKEVRLMP